MTKIVDVKGHEIFNRFSFETSNVAERVQLLNFAIEIRVQELLKKIDPKFVTSANVVNRRLNIPLKCKQDLDQMLEDQTLKDAARHQQLDAIQTSIFGQL